MSQDGGLHRDVSQVQYRVIMTGSMGLNLTLCSPRPSIDGPKCIYDLEMVKEILFYFFSKIK